MADTTRASKLQVFFCSGSFFFTQVRQVKVVFLRTLRNAATRLLASYSWVRSRGKGVLCRYKSQKTPPNSRQRRTKPLYSAATRANEPVREASRFNMKTRSRLLRIHPAPPLETMATVSSRDPGSSQRINFSSFRG